jgi:hypothetical protein
VVHIYDLILTLAVSSILLEIFGVVRFSFLLELPSRSKIVSLLFSLLVSATLGDIFGASGTVVLIAGLTSTAFMFVVYQSGVLLALQPMFAKFAM